MTADEIRAEFSVAKLKESFTALAADYEDGTSLKVVMDTTMRMGQLVIQAEIAAQLAELNANLAKICYEGMRLR